MELQDISKFRHAVESNNKRAIRSGAVANLTLEQFETAYIYFGGKCAYSGQAFLSKTNVSIEHIIPIISGGHSMAFNCIPVNGKYNSSKSGYHLLDWWKCQTDGFGNSFYNPYRLLKVLNYMIKCLEAINLNDESIHVLKDNEIDEFLALNIDKLNFNPKRTGDKSDYKKISQIEVFKKANMLMLEDLYPVYSELDSIKLNTAIFFEEAIHELEDVIPKEILHKVEMRIQELPRIYINNKKVFNREMNDEDVNVRRLVLEWAEREAIDNKYGIIGYMDFEVLKGQKDIFAFLDYRKETILKALGALPEDFNNIVNKIPNILTNLNVEKRIEELSKCFGLKRECYDKNSELYKYCVNKPDLLLAGENMEILLKYADKLHIDKRLLKRGIPITSIIDNIEMSMELVTKAELGVDESVEKRVFDKLVNATTGNLLREAYKSFKIRVKSENEELTKVEIERDAARWMLCISEKYSTSEMLRTKRIDKTRSLYKNMKFNEEGHLVGVNVNAYIVPQIIAFADLNISREAETEIINNVFFSKRIRQGERADKILRTLANVLKRDNPEYTSDNLLYEAARWFVFLSESSQVPLDEFFKIKDNNKYLEVTKKHYKNMRFDEKGNFINFEMPELKDLVIGVSYMQIADSFFNSKGDNYIIRGRLVPKSKIQGKLYAELSKCKNKKSVKSVCIRILKELKYKMEKDEGLGGEDR